jgi:hypothetical protein
MYNDKVVHLFKKNLLFKKTQNNMKKIISIIAISLASLSITRAQVTTAQDFTMSACNATTHSLFADHLDNGEVVIMEFFMTCGSCLAAGQKITPLYNGLSSTYPGMVNFWALAYTNTYTCATATNWVTTNSINAVPFDSGAAQVAYYGGFAMPTVVVVAGTQHQVIYNSNYDGAPGDTAAIHAAIDNFFATAGVDDAANSIKFSAYPNPVSQLLNIELHVAVAAQVTLDMADLNGKTVKQISNSMLSAGTHQMQVETSDLTNGVYFIRLQTNGRSTQYKISVKH